MFYLWLSIKFWKGVKTFLWNPSVKEDPAPFVDGFREKVFGNIWQRPHRHSPPWQLTKWKRLSWLDVFYSGYTTKGASNCCGMIQPPVTTNLTQTSKKQTLFIQEKIIQMWKLKSMTFSTQQIKFQIELLVVSRKHTKHKVKLQKHKKRFGCLGYNPKYPNGEYPRCHILLLRMKGLQ